MNAKWAIAAAVLVVFCVSVGVAEAAEGAKTKRGTAPAEGAKTKRGTAPAKAKSAAPVKAKKKPVEAKAAPKTEAALALTPPEIRFNPAALSAEVSVFLGDKPAQAAQVTNAWMVRYPGMFTVSKSTEGEAIVTVSAISGKVEDGSYRLAVEAGGQTEYVDVYYTAGPAPDEAEARLTLPPRLTLDATYAKGATLTYTLEGAPPDLMYMWGVNGRIVVEGAGKSSMEYTFTEPGPCTIRLTVKRGAEVLGQSVGKTQVTP